MPSPSATIHPLESRTLLAAHAPPGDVVLDWNDQTLAAIRVAKTNPPVASRNLAIVHLALFDAVNAIERKFDSYLPQNAAADKKVKPSKVDPTAAAAAAAHRALSALYPTLAAQFDAALTASLATVKDGPAETAGVALGRATADRLLAARAADGSAATVPHTPGTGPADWQPTAPAFAPALLPQWGAVDPFALAAPDQFRPAPPPAITSRAFARSFDQVKSLGSATSPARTADQTQIALFWADGAGTATPPGHWNVIAQDVADQRRTTRDLADTARLFALLNAGLADAAIACWDAKYAFDLLRPITAVRNAAADGNPLTLADPAWSPLIATPPFPSYTSGHSTFSAAAATILSSFFGTDRVTFTTTSDGLAGVTRTFKSFSAAAAEAGLSRIYGGIHYDFDNTAGQECGEQIGKLVTRTLLQPDHPGHGNGHHAPRCPALPALKILGALFSLKQIASDRFALD
ncbi:MAG TPA: phosphatase PAP2 family protein [Tepidisphaeraceae bacterium]|nr:phosphatase PAP2 family protein [Tepidisphaeraceae bacterium]